MPPKKAEYAAEYASKTHQKTADLDRKQLFCRSKTISIARRQMLKSLKSFVRKFWRKNPNGPFWFSIWFENYIQAQKNITICLLLDFLVLFCIGCQ